MPQIEKIKEEIGWLKVTFALLVAIDASLIGWFVPNFYEIPVFLILSAIFIVALVTWVIIDINRRAYKKIQKLGEL
uniref:Uncharacterized protein n=1 Tax=Candidatus Kentrum sp. MB TaxID=2138164 RepID=A0A450XCC9_9GAMM|nr:MAG: hypothetical protein BECKMB1821G_GA0114241_102423 [Candidatus Kentron sp. MB]VFK31201.1 MAG: hypothetical protein BECKMB1821I_GA0114274_102122 [Candidatus Kentron sp. MB]VFK75389.1 MAG: hypothetical protein BECKMB1821H_GA0114242_102123 [Candidatus Kentron sp. MB]